MCHGVMFIRFDLPADSPWFGRMYDCPVCVEPAKQFAQAAAMQNKIVSDSALNADEMGLSLDHIFERGQGSQKMIDHLRRMIETPYGMLTIYGGPGVGKTLALKVAVSEFVARGQSAVYCNLKELLDYLRQGYSETETVKTDERLRAVVNCKLLAIDELDKPRLTEWAQEIVFHLIDKRYLAGKRGDAHTIIAMNKHPHTLPAYLISRMRWDELGEGGFRVIENTDADARQGGL
jgi:DNA replication protein DnaC